MDESTALSVIYELKNTHTLTDEQKAAIETAENALRLNIPIKIRDRVHTYTGIYGKCAVCNAPVDDYKNGLRCSCGQMLNWEE